MSVLELFLLFKGIQQPLSSSKSHYFLGHNELLDQGRSDFSNLFCSQESGPSKPGMFPSVWRSTAQGILHRKGQSASTGETERILPVHDEK